MYSNNVPNLSNRYSTSSRSRRLELAPEYTRIEIYDSSDLEAIRDVLTDYRTGVAKSSPESVSSEQQSPPTNSPPNGYSTKRGKVIFKKCPLFSLKLSLKNEIFLKKI